jgi:hypothetical protein
MADMNQLQAALPQLSQAERKELAVAAAEALSADDKKQIASRMNVPTQGITDRIWLIIVAAFSFVLVGTFLAMAVSLYADKKVDTLLTVFTTTAAFLTGLLVPSPVASK